MSFAVVWAMVATSLVVLTGWGGNVSLGQFAIVGVGAMAAGNLMMRWNVDFIVAAHRRRRSPGPLVAVAIGLPALRIRGLYLAVTTLAFAVALDSYFLNPVNFASFVPAVDRAAGAVEAVRRSRASGPPSTCASAGSVLVHRCSCAASARAARAA